MTDDPIDAMRKRGEGEYDTDEDGMRDCETCGESLRLLDEHEWPDGPVYCSSCSIEKIDELQRQLSAGRQAIMDRLEVDPMGDGELESLNNLMLILQGPNPPDHCDTECERVQKDLGAANAEIERLRADCATKDQAGEVLIGADLEVKRLRDGLEKLEGEWREAGTEDRDEPHDDVADTFLECADQLKALRTKEGE